MPLLYSICSGYSEPLAWNKLSLAPIWLRNKFVALIERERDNALKGKPAKIIAKMNSLCDAGIIKALYDASAAGVEIDLIVRGICCLKQGIKGMSETICVRSIVGTFLEHSRIYYFENDGEIAIQKIENNIPIDNSVEEWIKEIEENVRKNKKSHRANRKLTEESNFAQAKILEYTPELKELLKLAEPTALMYR